MTPRAYSLGQRANTASATRERVIEAAADLYRERGIAATTLAAVAGRADVSRNTVVHHFGGVDGLLGAVIDEVVGLLDMPDERVLAGAGTAEARIRRYVGAILGFYDRSAEWWSVVEPAMQTATLQSREEAFVVSLGRFQAAAFGPLVTDRLVMAAANGFVHWAVLGTMRAAGASLEEVIDIVGDAIVRVVERQASQEEPPPELKADRAGGSRGRRGP